MSNKTIDEILSYTLSPLYSEMTGELIEEGILSEEEIGKLKDFKFEDLIGVYFMIDKQKIEDMENILQVLTKEEVIYQIIGGSKIRNTQRGIELSYELSSVYRLRAQKTLLSHNPCEFYNVWHTLAKYRAGSLWIDTKCQLIEIFFGIKFDTKPVIGLMGSESDLVSKKYPEQSIKFKHLIQWLQWLQSTYPGAIGEHIIQTSILDPESLIKAYAEYPRTLSF